MKKKNDEIEESPNIKDIRESQKKRMIAQDLYYLRKLLANLKTEDITFEELRLFVKTSNFKGAVLIESEGVIFRHTSILALTKYFNKKTTYELLPLDSIISIWFGEDSKDNKYSKSNSSLRNLIYNTDVLILYGLGTFDRNMGPLDRVLIEIVESRKVFNKCTWIFTNSSTKDKEQRLEQVRKYTNQAYYYKKGDTTNE